MDEKTRQLIEALAAKLGTTVEHLWGVLVRQAPISGAVHLVLCIVIATATWWWTALVWRKTRKPPETEDGAYMSAEWQDEAAALSWVCVFISVVFTLFYIFSKAEEVVSAFANPEYWALKYLMKH